MRKRCWFRILFILFLNAFLSNYKVIAQPWNSAPPSQQDNDNNAGEIGTDDAGDPGDTGPGGGGHGDPDEVPIDTNIWILVTAVVGYGVKKAWDAKKNVKKRNNLPTAGYEEFMY